MKLYIYSLESVVYEGEASVVTIPAKDGEIGVLDNHIPLVTSLKPGEIRVKRQNSEERFPINGGFAEIKPNKTILLVE